VAKLADALDLGSSSCNGSEGSSPFIRTNDLWRLPIPDIVAVLVATTFFAVNLPSPLPTGLNKPPRGAGLWPPVLALTHNARRRCNTVQERFLLRIIWVL
jgi:hypothetical protein